MAKKILIVDDEPEILTLIKYRARDHNYDCVAAQSGGECLEQVRALQPDLILLDINMPDISGLQVLADLKKDENLCDIPVIMLSAINQDSVVDKALQLGAQDYFTKDCQFGVLFDVVKKYV